jgi:glycosyltransferase involved in cell wall biosynthesis
MKICQVLTGMIPVLVQGQRRWGAVEKIIGEYQKPLIAMGHTVDTKYVNEISVGDYDIVHVHMANLALELKKKNIPYIFSLHDHHVEHYGKDSYCYKHNLEAIQGSIFSFTHAEHLLSYFDGTDKLFYLSHGVNTSYFRPDFRGIYGTFGTSGYPPKEQSLLMVANNGLAGDFGIDRKGFRVGIEAAKELNMPITIVGAEANYNFFDIHKELLDYERLIVDYSNTTEDRLLNYYRENTIFLHPSFLEAGHPNLTLLEAASCCLPIVGTYKGSNKITGMSVIKNISTEEVVYEVKKIVTQFDFIRNEMFKSRERYDWRYVCHNLIKSYEVVLNMRNESSAVVREKYYQAHKKQAV